MARLWKFKSDPEALKAKESEKGQVTRRADATWNVPIVVLPCKDSETVVVSYSEMNTMPDLFGNPEAIALTPKDKVLALLQGIRQQLYIELSNLRKELFGHAHNDLHNTITVDDDFATAQGPRAQQGTELGEKAATGVLSLGAKAVATHPYTAQKGVTGTASTMTDQEAEDAASEFNLVAYNALMSNAYIQAATKFFHDKFCKEGLEVQSGSGVLLGRIYGDANMLNAGGQFGLEYAAETSLSLRRVQPAQRRPGGVHDGRDRQAVPCESAVRGRTAADREVQRGTAAQG
jgi:hypothetical protein